MLIENMWTYVSCGFSLPGKGSNPIEVVILAPAVRMILHIFPYSVSDPLELILDVIGVPDSVEKASELNPPEVVVVRSQSLVV